MLPPSEDQAILPAAAIPSVGADGRAAATRQVHDRKAGHRVACLPAEARKPAARLLDQQFWLWGCDIRRVEGNLLTLLGFARLAAPPESGVRISQYRCVLTRSSRMSLWGFGICIDHDALGSLFLPRSGFTPRYARTVLDVTAAWEPGWFERTHGPAAMEDASSCYRLVMEAVAWIAWYEQRVLELAGARHRQRSLDAWPKAVCGCTEIGARWNQICVEVGRSYDAFLDG